VCATPDVKADRPEGDRSALCAAGGMPARFCLIFIHNVAATSARRAIASYVLRHSTAATDVAVAVEGCGSDKDRCVAACPGALRSAMDIQQKSGQPAVSGLNDCKPMIFICFVSGAHSVKQSRL